MRTGISTACLYPLEVEKSLEKLLSMDFKVFEIFFNTFSELSPAFLKQLQKLLRGTEACIKSIHPFTSGMEGILFFSEYRRRVDDGLDFYKRYFEAACALEAEILVLHGQKGYQAGKLTEDDYVERYLRLFWLGKSYGITVAQENVNQYRSESAAFVSRMKEKTGGECAFVLDIKQAIRAGEDPYAMCRAMGNRLVHLHINDNAPGADCLLPGRGEMDFRRLCAMLRETGYQGDCVIEVYRDNFAGLEELRPAKAFVSRLCAEFS